MSRPLRIEFPGAFYHVMARGLNRKAVFLKDTDRRKMLDCLEKATERYGIRVHGYCLMDNHYHLLVETPEGNLSKAMRLVNGNYAAYVNRKLGRIGPVLQGRYRSIVVDKESYGLELSRYIHLNPVKARMVSRPQGYRWSSYRAYIGQATEGWLSTTWMLSKFGKQQRRSQASYRRFVEEGMEAKVKDPLKDVVAGIALGGKGFVERIQSFLKGTKAKERDLPALRKIKPRPTFEGINKLVLAELKGKDAETRKVGIYLSHRYSGRPLKEIGFWFGKISESGVSQVVRRTTDERSRTKALDKTISRIEKRLKEDLSNV